MPYLPGSKPVPVAVARPRAIRHLQSSIPYLSNDGHEPRFQPKDPNYQSQPIWLREADELHSRKRLTHAKKESLASSVFDAGRQQQTQFRPLKVAAANLEESSAERPMFNPRKPKPGNVRSAFLSSFELS